MFSKKPSHHLPYALASLSRDTQALCQQVYISRAPNILMYLARLLIKMAKWIIIYPSYGGPYPAFDKEMLKRSANLLGTTPEPARALPFSPYVGRHNPISPALKFNIIKAGELVEATVIIPATFAGPTDTVHGGMVAGIFDDLLGAVNWSGPSSGFTGTLSVRYHKHTPILKPVQLSARCVKREGRKVFINGDMHYNGVCTASAEGIFIRPKYMGAPNISADANADKKQ